MKNEFFDDEEYLQEHREVTKYITTVKKGFDIELTSAGLTLKLRKEEENEMSDTFRADKTLPFLKQKLPKVSPPYLPKADPNGHKYCLVLDLDETLIHYVDNGPDSYFLVRPYCKEFLNELSKLYEIVIFTAGVLEYADWVLDQIDPESKIKHRLYREHTIIPEKERQQHIQNASKVDTGTGQQLHIIWAMISRPIEKTIIVDNIAENFIR